MGIVADIKNVISLPSPLRTVLDKKILENGLQLEKVSVPLGTIGVIYKSRPKDTSNVSSLCFKSSNACVLKGG